MSQQTMYAGQVNSPQTTLSAGIDNVVTTIPVVNASLLPAAPNLVTIGIDETAETILYTGISSNNLTGCTRGFQSTAASWATGIKVGRMFTAYDYNTIVSNIADIIIQSGLASGLTTLDKSSIVNGINEVNLRRKDLGFNVKDYGASGSGQSTTGSITTGTPTLTLTSAIDFANGQTINVLGIYEAASLSVTAPATSTGNVTVTLNGVGTTVAVQGGAAEVASLSVTAGATASANCTVTLNGTAFTVALTNGNTANQVATAIRAATFTGWTTGGSTTTVTFTSTTVGIKTDAIYSAGTTGATGTMTTTTQGVDADTATVIATAIRSTIYAGWTTGGSTTTVTFTSTSTGNKTDAIYSAGTTGATGTMTTTTQGVADFTTTISSGAGTTTLTLAVNASATYTSAAVSHDDTISIISTVNALAVLGGEVRFPAGTYVTGNITVPSNVTLSFANGAMLKVYSGAVINMSGSISAGLYQIFSGLGIISGNIKNPYLYPQWWGALGLTDDAAAINACIATAQSVGFEVTVFFPSGQYQINSSIIIRHGLTAHNVNIVGYGARLIAGTASMKMIKIQGYDGTTVGGTGLTNIMGFRLYGSGNQSYGIFIGKTIKSDIAIDGISPSMIRDIQIENVQFGVCVSGARMWRFENVNCSIAVVPTSCGFLIQSLFDGFTGDIWISKCNIVVEVANGRGIILTSTSQTGTSTLNGIHIDNCVIYGSGLYASTTNANATINDIFIDNVAFDAGGTNYAINLVAFSNRQITDILITTPWINGFNAGINVSNCWGVIVMGGKISSTQFQAIDFELCSHCKAIGVNMYDCNKIGSGGGIVKLGSTGSWNKVMDCNLYNTTSYVNQWILLEAGQVKPIVRGNQKDAATIIVNNVAGVEGTDFIISGNL